jgi:hypothetical protein
LKHVSIGAQRSGSKTSSINARAPAASPDSRRQIASAVPGPPPTDGIAAPVRLPIRALSSHAATAASRWPAK